MAKFFPNLCCHNYQVRGKTKYPLPRRSIVTFELILKLFPSSCCHDTQEHCDVMDTLQKRLTVTLDLTGYKRPFGCHDKEARGKRTRMLQMRLTISLPLRLRGERGEMRSGKRREMKGSMDGEEVGRGK